MNLLPIVISLLLLMSALAYVQLASMTERTLIRREYTCFIQNHLRIEHNELQEKLYASHRYPKERNREDPQSPALGRKKINFVFFTTEFSKELINRPYREVLNRLIDKLYSHRKFYQEALEHNSNLPETITDAVLDAIGEKMDEGEFKTQFASSEELSTLTLRDPLLNDLWQEMVRRVELPGSLQAECGGKKVNSASKQEYEPNLLDFLALPDARRVPYRIWLAEKSLLEALFPRPETVDEIMVMRSRMYNDLRRIKKDDRGSEFELMKQSLQDRFQREGYPDLPDEAFDFTVSLSKPPRSRK